MPCERITLFTRNCCIRCNLCRDFDYNSSIEGKVVQKLREDMGTHITHFCSTTTIHDNSFVVMFYHISLNYDRKFLSFLILKDLFCQIKTLFFSTKMNSTMYKTEKLGLFKKIIKCSRYNIWVNMKQIRKLSTSFEML